MAYTPPPAGDCVFLEQDVRCILAPNPSPMTFHGTNTYLLGRGEVCVIDPGPGLSTHRDAILRALGPGEQIVAILCTHAHLDHTPLAARLSTDTGAPVYAYGTALAGESQAMSQLRQTGGLGGGEGIDHAFTPDETLSDGAEITLGGMSIQAIWTPGHLSNHLCFAQGDRVFSGDHVMDWATSMISPPDGDLTAFMSSLDKLKGTSARVFYPGHGAPVSDPAARVSELYAHRKTREAQIIAALATQSGTAEDLAKRIYTDIAPALIPAATRNVLAHLIALCDQAKARHIGPFTETAEFEAN